jgi:hypothetical protein
MLLAAALKDRPTRLTWPLVCFACRNTAAGFFLEALFGKP